ncbi:hypothetical protein TSUD_82500 [Trifolium subterraneum]|uniref:Transmembrane protein n=1 Tax=Trifolium subterraneum TaxID=3900 RepID=A0A2Z6LLI5_TRISU|nr:hypothetical protein TSUD_82500 [Trifolium subterraneum]
MFRWFGVFGGVSHGCFQLWCFVVVLIVFGSPDLVLTVTVFAVALVVVTCDEVV